MQSPNYFLIKPKGGNKYKNVENIDGVDIIIEDSYDNGHTTNREAIVVGVPLDYEGSVKEGDTLIVHHNTFRVMRNQRRKLVFSKKHIKDDLYWTDVYYLHIDQDGNINSAFPYVFLDIQDKEDLIYGKQKDDNGGVVVFTNKKAEELGIKKGNKYVFKDDMNATYNIDGKDYYRVQVKDLLALV